MNQNTTLGEFITRHETYFKGMLLSADMYLHELSKAYAHRMESVVDRKHPAFKQYDAALQRIHNSPL